MNIAKMTSNLPQLVEKTSLKEGAIKAQQAINKSIKNVPEFKFNSAKASADFFIKNGKTPTEQKLDMESLKESLKTKYIDCNGYYRGSKSLWRQLDGINALRASTNNEYYSLANGNSNIKLYNCKFTAEDVAKAFEKHGLTQTEKKLNLQEHFAAKKAEKELELAEKLRYEKIEQELKAERKAKQEFLKLVTGEKSGKSAEESAQAFIDNGLTTAEIKLNSADRKSELQEKYKVNTDEIRQNVYNMFDGQQKKWSSSENYRNYHKKCLSASKEIENAVKDTQYMTPKQQAEFEKSIYQKIEYGKPEIETKTPTSKVAKESAEIETPIEKTYQETLPQNEGNSNIAETTTKIEVPEETTCQDTISQAEEKLDIPETTTKTERFKDKITSFIKNLF